MGSADLPEPQLHASISEAARGGKVLQCSAKPEGWHKPVMCNLVWRMTNYSTKYHDTVKFCLPADKAGECCSVKLYEN
jgi:hypothetical protein